MNEEAAKATRSWASSLLPLSPSCEKRTRHSCEHDLAERSSSSASKLHDSSVIHSGAELAHAHRVHGLQHGEQAVTSQNRMDMACRDLPAHARLPPEAGQQHQTSMRTDDGVIRIRRNSYSGISASGRAPPDAAPQHPANASSTHEGEENAAKSRRVSLSEMTAYRQPQTATERGPLLPGPPCLEQDTQHASQSRQHAGGAKGQSARDLPTGPIQRATFGLTMLSTCEDEGAGGMQKGQGHAQSNRPWSGMLDANTRAERRHHNEETAGARAMSADMVSNRASSQAGQQQPEAPNSGTLKDHVLHGFGAVQGALASRAIAGCASESGQYSRSEQPVAGCEAALQGEAKRTVHPSRLREGWSHMVSQLERRQHHRLRPQHQPTYRNRYSWIWSFDF